MATDKALDILRSRQLFYKGTSPLMPIIQCVTRRVASVIVCSLRDIATIHSHGMSQ